MSNTDIQALAKQAGFRAGEIITSDGNSVPFISPASATDCKPELERFADLYREALFAEVLAGSGEPVANVSTSHNGYIGFVKPDKHYYTADHLAAAVLRGIEQGKRERDTELLAGSENIDQHYRDHFGTYMVDSEPKKWAEQLTAAAVLREREKSKALLEALEEAQVQIENQCDVGVDDWIACREKVSATIAQYKGEQA